MSIPEFPDSREITLEDKPLIDSLLVQKRPEISAYTFTNMFAWREPHRVRLSRIGECVLVHYNDGDARVCLEPLADEPAASVAEEVFARTAPREIEFGYVGGEFAGRFAGRERFGVVEDRNNADYVYSSDDLINLMGRRYDAKRNFVNRFQQNYDSDYVRLDQSIALECLEFAHKWCEDRSCETVEGLRREQCAVYQMLTHFEDLGIVGGALRVSGTIAAFCLGEKLNPETLVVHVEKADAKIDGIYQAINQAFCAHEAIDLKYVNREQDLGVPGLRKAKESYNPVRLVAAYRVRRE